MRTPIIRESLYECVDKDGKWYELVDRFKRSADVEVFLSGTSVCIRQENIDGVDLIELSLGQAYDLLTAIAKTLDIPAGAV